jgi:hypothetical protein
MPEGEKQEQDAIHEKLEQILLRLGGLPALLVPRRQISPALCWVDERELPEYFPYTLKEIRKMRKDGKLRAYTDISGGKKVIYNLHEVSAKIQGSSGKPLLEFDLDSIKIRLG